MVANLRKGGIKIKALPAYRKEYKLRTVGEREYTVEVSFPKEVVEKKARELGLSLREFIETYDAVAYYNAFEGVLYRFEPREKAFKVPKVALQE